MRSFVVLLVTFFLIGCANVQQMKEAKQESKYRKELLKESKSNKRDQLLLDTVEERSYYEEVLRCDNIVSTEKRKTYKERYNIDLESDCEIEKVQRVHATPIEMPQEWLNQWPSLRDPNYVEPIKTEPMEITDPCEQLGPAYC